MLFTFPTPGEKAAMPLRDVLNSKMISYFTTLTLHRLISGTSVYLR